MTDVQEFGCSTEVERGDTPAAATITEGTRTGGCLRKRAAIDSRAVIAILAINALLDGSYYSSLSSILYAFGALQFKTVGLTFFCAYLLPTATPLLFYPLAGWVADALLGRHGTIRASLWVVASGQVVVFVAFVILPVFQDGPLDVDHVSVYAKVLVAAVYACVSAGFAGLQTNIIPFCLDQMAYASGDQLSAMVQWYYWTYNLRNVFFVVLPCLLQQSGLEYYTIQFGITACFMVLALLLWHLWTPMFSVEPKGRDPVGTVCGVLAFAATHRYPRFQSSLTSRRPSRLELSKSSFGGPYASEDVDDVRSFLRVTVVLMSLGTFVIVDYAIEPNFSDHFSNYPIFGAKCMSNDLLVSICEIAPIFIGIPLYQFVIYPLLPAKLTPSIFVSIGLGLTCSIASTLSFTVIDWSGHSQNAGVPCFLSSNSTGPFAGSDVFSDNYVLILPYLLGTLADMLIYIAAFQFICAQAPYNMRGILFGVQYFFTGFFALLSGITNLSITYYYKYPSPSCDSVYFIVNVFIGIVGFVVFVLTAIKYKKRKRTDHIGQECETTEFSINAT